MSNAQVQVLEEKVAKLTAALKAMVSDARSMQHTLTEHELGEDAEGLVTPDAFFGGFGATYDAHNGSICEAGDDMYVEWPNLAISLAEAEKLLATL